MRSVSRLRIAILSLTLGVAAIIAANWGFAPGASDPLRSANQAAIPSDLESAVREAFADDRCTSATAAQEAIGSRLVDLGYTDWAVSQGDHIDAEDCVTTTIDGAGQRVVLIPALRLQVREAMQGVANDLIDRCFSDAEAREYLASVLDRLGEEDYGIRSGGPIAAPVERVEEVTRHVKAGCTVYSGTGWTAEGRRLYFLAGQDP